MCSSDLGMVREANGPVYEGNQLVYAPIIIGGHYNNYNFKDSWERGGEYVVRGKGINIFRDILLGLYSPGIYHDPMPYANIPRMDREKFYKDTFEFSDETKKYALSRIKSILTALRSEEHTSELQSRTNLVCRLLLEKKKKNKL